MTYYLSFDGGGTKLNGMLYDGDMNLLCTCRAGGINTTQGTLDDCKRSIADALDQLFSAFTPERVETMYLTGVGVFPLLIEAVCARLPVSRVEQMEEGLGGLLAGALRDTGILALSGTGSDIFYYRADGARLGAVGGWGPILGDDGSGVWIGQQALRAVVRYVNGWGEETLLYPLIRDEWGLKDDWDMVTRVHSSPAPLRVAGSITPLVGRAAQQGDTVALGILTDAGRYMALQADTLIRRYGVGPEEWRVTLCGGAWKSHPVMLNTFRDYLCTRYPGLVVEKPLFEHLICGPAKCLLERGLKREEAQALLEERFPLYRIKYPYDDDGGVTP